MPKSKVPVTTPNQEAAITAILKLTVNQRRNVLRMFCWNCLQLDVMGTHKH